MTRIEGVPIHLESVGKCYRIYRNPQDRFRQAILDRFRRSGLHKGHSPLYREHWAVRDVSLELRAGEAVGILGRNGAGKSTLLQLIAGTLEPTEGEVRTEGRITALLELGSGFNPEFTGRENVFLNGQILGLGKREIESKFDEIAAFADIGDFLEQPVKTYSSGMMMRLAFAVQTAVDPKVLIVDEALSVGDMFFQAKCMARIRKLVDDGVSLLFVSHDVGTVRQICSRALLLRDGRPVALGDSRTVSDEYVKHQLEDRNLASGAGVAKSRPAAADDRLNGSGGDVSAGDTAPGGDAAPGDHLVPAGEPVLDRLELGADFGREAFEARANESRMGDGRARILNVQMLVDGTHTTDVEFGDKVEIRVSARFAECLKNVNASLIIRTLQGADIVFMDSRLQGQLHRSYAAKAVATYQWTIELPLMHGNYALSCGLTLPPTETGGDWQFLDMVPIAYTFRVAPRMEGMIGGYVALPADLQVVVR